MPEKKLGKQSTLLPPNETDQNQKPHTENLFEGSVGQENNLTLQNTANTKIIH